MQILNKLILNLPERIQIFKDVFFTFLCAQIFEVGHPPERPNFVETDYKPFLTAVFGPAVV